MFGRIRKKRNYEVKKRLYIEAQYLNEADFKIGKHIKYRINKAKNKITIILAKEDELTSNTVAQTTNKTGKIVPVIDIKKDDIREFFSQNQEFEVSIYKGRIIFNVKKVISKPKYVRTKFYAVDGVDQGIYIGFESEDEANYWVEQIKEDTPQHPYLQSKGFIKKEFLYPNYSEDIEKAFEMEEKIQDLHLEGYYVKALCDIVGASTDGTRSFKMDDWRLIHSSSLNRCEAGLIALLKLK